MLIACIIIVPDILLKEQLREMVFSHSILSV